MLDPNKIRLRIRHFLFQQSKLFQRTVAKSSESSLSISAVAGELAQQVSMSKRRLEKYLTKELGPKEVSITLTDLELFAGMKGVSLSGFIAYLLEEESSGEDLVGWKKSVVDFFQSLHEGHRRALAATMLSGKDAKRSEKLVELMIQLYTLSEQDLAAIEYIIEAFKQRTKSGI